MTVILGVTLETFAALAITVFLTGFLLNMSFCLSGRREMTKKVYKLKMKALTSPLTPDEQEKVDNLASYNRTYLLFGIVSVLVTATLGGAFALGFCDYMMISAWYGYVLIGISFTFLWSILLWATVIQGAADGENFDKVIKPTYEKFLEPAVDKVGEAVDDSALVGKLKSMSFAEVMELMAKR